MVASCRGEGTFVEREYLFLTDAEPYSESNPQMIKTYLLHPEGRNAQQFQRGILSPQVGMHVGQQAVLDTHELALGGLHYMHANNLAHLVDIKNTLSPQASKEDAKEIIDCRLQQMEGYDEAAYFEMSRIPVKDARLKFLEGSYFLERGNVTDAHAMSFLKYVDALHQALQRATRGCGSFEIQRRKVEQRVTRLQEGKQLNCNSSAAPCRHVGIGIARRDLATVRGESYCSLQFVHHAAFATQPSGDFFVFTRSEVDDYVTKSYGLARSSSLSQCATSFGYLPFSGYVIQCFGGLEELSLLHILSYRVIGQFLAVVC
eukprot:Skav210363  [mRNA]  locus=scaffold1357:80111:81061:+ [translate_table: standard]